MNTILKIDGLNTQMSKKEIKKKYFPILYKEWKAGSCTLKQVASTLGVCCSTVSRWKKSYENSLGYKENHVNKKKVKAFNKNILKTGDIVKFRSNLEGVVILEMGVILLKEGYNISVCDFQDNSSLEHKSDPDCDIVSVRRCKRSSRLCCFEVNDAKIGKLVYDEERDCPVKMTLDEVCKALGKNIEIV